MLEPSRHPLIPKPGELGPDPEPLGTERFLRLMGALEPQGPLPPEPIVLPVPRRGPDGLREDDQAAA